MPLTANLHPFITCAVTGSGGTQDRSPHVPRSPEQIAASAIDAAKAGAAPGCRLGVGQRAGRRRPRQAPELVAADWHRQIKVANALLFTD